MIATSAKTKHEETPKEEKLTSLKDLFTHEVRELYDAEKHMMKELQGLKSASTSKELIDALEDHIDITEIQVKRIDEIFNQLNIKHKELPNDAIAGLIEDGEALLKSITNPMVKDSAIIATVQKIKHYEIACYGCLRTFAMVLGLDEPSDLLQATLDEEIHADKKLTEIAEAYINEDAYHV